jgi:hypothetical protein
MKKNHCIALLMILVTTWGVGFFLFQATAVIHSLAWLAVLLLIHCMLKGHLEPTIESEEQQS